MRYLIVTPVVAIMVLLMGSGATRAETVALTTAGEWQSLSDAGLPEELARARGYLEQDRPGKALKVVKKWIKKNPGAPAIDHALFIKGQALYARNRLFGAFLAYDELLTQNNTSVYFESVLRQEVEIARRFFAGEKRRLLGIFRLSAKTEGIEILDRVIERWPGSELAARALMMQGDHFFEEERFIEAQETYQIIIDIYQRGAGYYPVAMYRSAEATFNQYRGAEYDSGCLDDAEVRYRLFMAAYPERAEDLGVPERLATIGDRRIGKQYATADFYRRTKKIRAARWYWNMIVERWPETEWARMARQNLEEYAPAEAG